MLHYLSLPPGVLASDVGSSEWNYNGEVFKNCYHPGLSYLVRNLEYFRSEDSLEQTKDLVLQKKKRD